MQLMFLKYLMRSLFVSETATFQKAEHEKMILEARNHMMEMVGTVHKYFYIALHSSFLSCLIWGFRKKKKKKD